jgi:ATP-dependent DNA helicase RecG
VREAVCAFANDLAGPWQPGAMFIGARDDGTPPPGSTVTDELLRQLADIKTDGNIAPPPTLLVEKRHLAGHDFAVVTVWPCDTPPVRYKGRIHVYAGDRAAGLASAQDERILNERRRHRDRPFDVQPVADATLDELDRLRFEQEYLPALVARDVLAGQRAQLRAKAGGNQARAERCRTATHRARSAGGRQVAGRLAPRRVHAVPAARRQRPHRRRWRTRMSIHGTVADQIRRLEEKLEVHNLRGVRFADTAQESRNEAYPMDALRQLVRNACMHRSYEATNAPVRVYWFDDRIEIHNPGGPFGSVTPENFGQPGVTDYRNPNLAEALRALGYVQRFGAGIAIARKALGGRLRFEVQPGFVAAIVAGEQP